MPASVYSFTEHYLRQLSTVCILCTHGASLDIRVILDSRVPVYRQLVDQLRALCVEGRLKPEQKLPSVREMAANLGVHHNTVAEAYRTLADEAWLAIEHGRGVRVLDRRTPLTPTAQAEADFGARLRNLIAELRAQGFAPGWIQREVDAALRATGGRP